MNSVFKCCLRQQYPIQGQSPAKPFSLKRSAQNKRIRQSLPSLIDESLKITKKKSSFLKNQKVESDCQTVPLRQTQAYYILIDSTESVLQGQQKEKIEQKKSRTKRAFLDDSKDNGRLSISFVLKQKKKGKNQQNEKNKKNQIYESVVLN